MQTTTDRFAAVLADGAAPGYVCVRAIIATAGERDNRLAWLTAMGRDFVTEVRRRICAGDAAALLEEPPSVREGILEHATRQLAAGDGRKPLAMQKLSRDSGIPRSTLSHLYSATQLDTACRRRSQTIWRARFERTVLAATDDPRRRLFAVFDAFDAWVASPRFRADQALCARPSITARLQDDDLREHLSEVDRFATALGIAAGLASPSAFAAFVTTSVAGAAAWYDRRAAARAASVAFVERELTRRC